MPFFRKSANIASDNSPKESKREDRKNRGKNGTQGNSTNEKSTPPTQPSKETRENSQNVPNDKAVPSPASKEKMKRQRGAPKPASSVPPPDPYASSPTPPRFVFYCQLAHGSATAKVEGFTNVKQLYEKIAAAFRIKDDEVSFKCLFVQLLYKISIFVCTSSTAYTSS